MNSLSARESRFYCFGGKLEIQLTNATSLSVLAAGVQRRGTRLLCFGPDFHSKEGSLAENSLTRSPEARWSLTSRSSAASMLEARFFLAFGFSDDESTVVD